MTYDLWIGSEQIAQGFSEEAMRALIIAMGYDGFVVYNSAGFDKTEEIFS